MKNELRNIGLFLITPFPQKYHFEGVDNRHSAKQLAAIVGVTYVAAFGYALFGSQISEKVYDIKSKLQSKKNK